MSRDYFKTISLVLCAVIHDTLDRGKKTSILYVDHWFSVKQGSSLLFWK